LCFVSHDQKVLEAHWLPTAIFSVPLAGGFSRRRGEIRPGKRSGPLLLDPSPHRLPQIVPGIEMPGGFPSTSLLVPLLRRPTTSCLGAQQLTASGSHVSGVPKRVVILMCPYASIAQTFVVRFLGFFMFDRRWRGSSSARARGPHSGRVQSCGVANLEGVSLTMVWRASNLGPRVASGARPSPKGQPSCGTSRRCSADRERVQVTRHALGETGGGALRCIEMRIGPVELHYCAPRTLVRSAPCRSERDALRVGDSTALHATAVRASCLG
jgi:hypothetical protein